MPDALHSFAQSLRALTALYGQVAARQSAGYEALGKPALLAVAFLGDRGPQPMSAIADHLGVVRSAVTPLVDTLEREGIVRRERFSQDRRVWHVDLTARGREIHDAEAAVYREVAAQMLAPLEVAERETLISLIERVREGIETGREA